MIKDVFNSIIKGLLSATAQHLPLALGYVYVAVQLLITV